ncbi:MAG: hypothetical protein AAF548_13595 [Actinomycetota bacterium]
MPLRLAVVGFALIALACAPDPEAITADDLFDATTTTTTITDGTVPPETTVPPAPTVPGPGLVPPSSLPPSFSEPPEGTIDRVRGRIAVQAETAAIRTDLSTIDLPVDGLPAQPTWSRDGARLAIGLLDIDGASVAVFDAAGEQIAETEARVPYFFFSWNHDATRIAALGPTVDGTTLDILDADGTLLVENVATAASLYVAWDPDESRLVAHADDRLFRWDDHGTITELGEVGFFFFAPKWIPGTDEIVVVADIEGSEILVRRGVEGGDPLTTLGDIDTLTKIAVHPDGDVAAVGITFEVEGGGGTGERVAFTPPLAQEAPVLSGEVDIIDLRTGERVTVFRGHALWTEWNPTGDRLLIGTTDTAEGTGAWWIYEHTDPFAAELDDHVIINAVETYTPTGVFANSYLPFADQYIETPRLWAPTGDAFVYADLTTDGPWAFAVDLAVPFAPLIVDRASVAFWSPQG